MTTPQPTPWNCRNCGATGNLGHACRKCLAAKPVEPPEPKNVYAPPCLYCQQPTEERAYWRETLFGPMQQYGRFCPHCNSWQV